MPGLFVVTNIDPNDVELLSAFQSRYAGTICCNAVSVIATSQMSKFQSRYAGTICCNLLGIQIKDIDFRFNPVMPGLFVVTLKISKN